MKIPLLRRVVVTVGVFGRQSAPPLLSVLPIKIGAIPKQGQESLTTNDDSVARLGGVSGGVGRVAMTEAATVTAERHGVATPATEAKWARAAV